MKNTVLILLILSFFTGCNDPNVNLKIKKTDQLAYNNPPKMKLFRKIDSLQKIMADISSTNFTSWRKNTSFDQEVFWTSHTPITQFGGFSKNGLKNDIGYQILGFEKNNVNEIEITLNVKNPKEYKVALDYLSTWSTETLRGLNIDSPTGLNKSILKGEQYYKENELNYIFLQKQDKDLNQKINHESWRLVLKSK